MSFPYSTRFDRVDHGYPHITAFNELGVISHLNEVLKEGFLAGTGAS